MGTMRVEHAPSSAGLVRHRIAADLADRGVVDDSIAQVVLIASELVSNAIAHTPDAPGTPLGVTWELDPEAVTVGVSDPSPVLPSMRSAGVSAPDGRGLQIVAAVAEGWGVAPNPVGKRVWARVQVQRDE